jgi:molybdopterin-guanine dinucleotide biosynthesis protein A
MADIIIKKKPEALIISHEGFIEPFHAFYSKKITDKIETFLSTDSSGIFSFLKTIKPLVIELERIDSTKSNHQIFSNINSREDLDKINRTHKLTS